MTQKTRKGAHLDGGQVFSVTGGQWHIARISPGKVPLAESGPASALQHTGCWKVVIPSARSGRVRTLGSEIRGTVLLPPGVSSEDPRWLPQEERPLKGCLVIPTDSRVEAKSSTYCSVLRFWGLLTWAHASATSYPRLPLWTRGHGAAGEVHSSGAQGQCMQPKEHASVWGRRTEGGLFRPPAVVDTGSRPFAFYLCIVANLRAFKGAAG